MGAGAGADTHTVGTRARGTFFISIIQFYTLWHFAQKKSVHTHTHTHTVWLCEFGSTFRTKRPASCKTFPSTFSLMPCVALIGEAGPKQGPSFARASRPVSPSCPILPQPVLLPAKLQKNPSKKERASATTEHLEFTTAQNEKLQNALPSPGRERERMGGRGRDLPAPRH